MSHFTVTQLSALQARSAPLGQMEVRYLLEQCISLLDADECRTRRLMSLLGDLDNLQRHLQEQDEHIANLRRSLEGLDAENTDLTTQLTTAADNLKRTVDDARVEYARLWDCLDDAGVSRAEAAGLDKELML